MATNDPTPEIPYGYCHCGCGELTKPARITINAIGIKKGEPQRFLNGHYMRNRPTKGYRTRRNVNGSPLVHVQRAERALGHPLPLGAQIHHPDGDRGNPNARLVICQDQKFHGLLHKRARIKKMGGNPNTDAYCSVCRQIKPLAAFTRNGKISRCRECVSRLNREYRQQLGEALRAKKRAQYRARIKAQQQPPLDLPEPQTDTNG